MIDPRIKLRHLQCFLAVARQGGIGRAAEALAVSQPAVSKTIRELEEILGTSLLERGRRGVRVTRFGEVFLRHATASVMALQQGLDSVSSARLRGGHVVTAGVLPNVAARTMPRAVELFKHAAVETIVRVSTASNATLLDELKRGELDLVVGRLVDPDQMVGLTFEHLYSEPMTFVVRAGHPLLDEKPFDLAAIGHLPLSLPPAGTVIRREIDHFLTARGVRLPSDRIETISVTFGRAHAMAGDAVWAVPRGAVIGDLAAGLLAELPIERTSLMGAIGLTMRADVAPSPLVGLLISAIREASAEIRDEHGRD